MRVGVPSDTGRQPSHNGRWHFLSPVCDAPFWRVGVPLVTGRQPSHNSLRPFLFPWFCGIPFCTGRQPSQNGWCHFLFSVFGVLPFWMVGVPLYTGRQPSHNGQSIFFFPESAASRFLRDASPRRLSRTFFSATFQSSCRFVWVGVPGQSSAQAWCAPGLPANR